MTHGFAIGRRARPHRHQRPISARATTTPIRTRSATSRRSTWRCRTSRTAGRAATTSSSATTGSAIAGSSRAQPCDILLPRSERQRERCSSCTTRRTTSTERRRLQRRVHQRYVEVQRSADVQPRACGSKHYVDGFPDHSPCPCRPCRARQLASRPQSNRTRALPGAHRTADGGGANGGRHLQRVTSRRASPTTSPATIERC